MINSNYNFRTAFNQVKEAKKYQRETEVDQFLKEVITKINEDEDDDIYENMLEEILFLQTESSDVDVYLKLPFPDKAEDDGNSFYDEGDEEFPYQYLCDKSFSHFSEACNFLDLLAKKLEEEGFSVKPYTGENAAEDGKSFTVVDKPR